MKIGITRSVRTRLSQLQVNCDDRLLLLGAVTVSTPRFEGAIHRLFADHHISGEWFRVTPKLLGFITNALAKGALVEAWTGLRLFGKP